MRRIPDSTSTAERAAEPPRGTVALRLARYALTAGALASFAVLVWDLTTGGFHLRILGLRVSSWEWYKPLRNGILCSVAALWLHDRTAGRERTSWAFFRAAAPWVGGAAAVAAMVMAIRFGTFVAGGADSYGYVTEAQLLASGHLTARDPLSALESTLGTAVAPLGYRLSRTPGVLTPVYAPGLPLVMAAASIIGGPSAVYFVVPLLAALAVWLTYLLAARIADPATAAVASVLIATSPIFVFQSIQPMSDVPATAWWLLSWVLAVSSGAGAAFAAGLAASAAILTRPNLVPLTIVIAAQVLIRPHRTRVVWFALGVVPACLAIAALNAYLNGSPLRPGYGPLESLFAWEYVSQNAKNYSTWLFELLTPGIALAVVAPLVVRARASAILMLAFVAATITLYLGYLVFGNWTFLRFLLPAIPLLFVLASAVVVWCLEQTPLAVRGALVLLLCTLLPTWYLVKAERLHVFVARQAESRYRAVGEFLRTNLPSNAIVVTLTESGSVRLYGERPTVLWEAIDPGRLDAVLAAVRAHGYAPYLLLESWEEDPFRARFAKASVFGAVDWPPAIQYFGTSDVRVYAIDDRARHIEGMHILPKVVPTDPSE